MLDLIIPSEKNGYKAHLLKIPILIIFTIVITFFNLFAKSSIIAQDYSTLINNESLLVEHNKFRKENNLPELKLNSLLNQSATKKATEMLNLDCWSHYCPEGTQPWKYFDDVGYIYTYAGENLAEGFSNITDVMNAWINSKTHRENILKPEFTEVGFGLITGSYQNRNNNLIIAVHFGSQASYVSADLNSSKITILNPKENETINSEFINVDGQAIGVDKLTIYNNSEYKASPAILDGVFTYRIEDPVQGKNIIVVNGTTQTGEDLNSSVEVNVNLPNNTGNEISIKSDSLIAGFTPGLQNTVNVAFLLFLALLFLIDFVALSRTKMLSSVRSFSHYHFSLLIILIFVILIGGFTGSVGLGIFTLP